MFKQKKKNIDVFIMTKNNEITGYGIDRVDTLIFYKRNFKKLNLEGHRLRHKQISENYVGHLVGLSYDKTKNVIFMKN